MKMLYALIGLLIIGGYAWADWNGQEFNRARRGYAPQSLRGSQSGARSFWYTGYHGGK
jgi:hypothetical protein